jgi:penicillin-binding protein 2
MLIFDQLKKNDPQLRLLALLMTVGLGILLAGLWWVQVVSGREFQTRLETQSYRSVRIPPVRGRILDRNGVALADNRPSFDASLYLEDMRLAFKDTFTNRLAGVRSQLATARAEAERKAGRKLTPAEAKAFALTYQLRSEVGRQARYEVVTNVVASLADDLDQPLALSQTNFEAHYSQRLVLPLPLSESLDLTNLARFMESPASQAGLDLDLQPVRHYPYGTLAAHLLGQLQRSVAPADGEDSYLNYPLPVYRGTVGIEGTFDKSLRGRAGSKAVLVNNLGYRQSEFVWSQAVPGDNVRLTLDARIQQAAERALAKVSPEVRGAVVVMDPRNGDLLALASAPAYDPALFLRPITRTNWDRLNDPATRPQINRALQENYAPGSIFKIIVGLAMLQHGISPQEKITVPPDPARPGRGCIYIGRRKIEDTAPHGEYDFRRGFLKSSNHYFITNGLRTGAQNIVLLAQRFHLGERGGIPTGQEVPGILPSLERVGRGWTDGDTANLCLGQGELAVTPLQMATMTAAIANGGTIFWPRLVMSVEPQDSFDTQPRQSYPAGRVRDRLPINPGPLKSLREAMLADTVDDEGTGHAAFFRGGKAVSFSVGGKTGTAQVTDEHNRVVNHIAWFVSFAPVENPRYVVVTMIEGGTSGGGMAAPVCRDVYQAIEQIEGSTAKTVAQRNR